MLYQIIDGTVSVGGNTVLSHIDFEIKGTEKIAVVGRNGAGKSTLLNVIAGNLELDRDDKGINSGITTSRKVTIGMLSQSAQFDENKTVEEILLEKCPIKDTFSRERFMYEVEYDRIFTGFGFEKADKARRFGTFSGGQKTKISMICLLLQKPDILLLDEPTNHLDIKTTQWLEEYMRQYEKAVVFVSHDRFFLDQVVDVVYELKDKKLSRFVGNYTSYKEQKRKLVESQLNAYERQQKEIKRLNDLVEKFKHKPKKAAFARSRRTILNRMELVEKPAQDDAHIFTGELTPLVPGAKWVVETEHLKIGYDKVLAELSVRIRRGQKIAVIGDNGVGKTTFLKTIAGLVEPISGKCSIGNQILIGYFDQQAASIQSEDTVLEHFHKLFASITEKEARQSLGAYLFRGAMVNSKVSNLSGGEKSRLLLCELMMSRPNFLVLDEPTNHMDVPAKETLESAFRAYTGTMLFVSHDRYFISRVADAILVFNGDEVMYYPFGYEHYIMKMKENGGGNLAAMVKARDQAMIASLKAVPAKENHETRPLTTEEAYFDWRRRLAAEPMEEARCNVEGLWEKLEVMQKKKSEAYDYLLWKEKIPRDSSFVTWSDEDEEKYKEIMNAYQLAIEEWTRCCVEWYFVE